eukprot:CAMPEP_0206382724 /NCGR_PEP_ID=MMETSP0294-20121207/13465_1 /ASSEMBLY_ACC=CAM_ASM_000327 /TAXON_ID=39354 /ORGANISM="Heterosigma akashiwo, Strain CCMP2393" /LENGTH=371 /DNA_ID=CAMNT_0053832529 /DNA_START=49 /DNA_END=1161 /DNA_ORIENTATION=+
MSLGQRTTLKATFTKCFGALLVFFMFARNAVTASKLSGLGQEFLRGNLVASRRGVKWNKSSPPFVYHPEYSCPWPSNHRFPMWKFKGLFEVLCKDHIIREGEYFVPLDDPPHEWFTLVHDERYYKGFLDNTLTNDEWRRIGFRPGPGLVRRTRLEVAGTLLTAQLALQHGLACNLAGGTHHAHKGYGSGYTILNDLAITAKVLQESNIGVEKVLIVDLDVHQGDGTASIFEGDPSVFTFSMHCENNFPLRKMRSDLDVGLPPGTDDQEYMRVLQSNLERVLDEFPADLVLYDAGIDPYEGDRLGLLNISERGLYDRDSHTIRTCLGRGLPVACVIGGGYDDNAAALARRHSIVHRAAVRAWREMGVGKLVW